MGENHSKIAPEQELMTAKDIDIQKDKSQEMDKCFPVRMIVLVIITVALVQVLVYFKYDVNRPFALYRESLLGRTVTVNCSPEYINTVEKFKGCAPKECKRYVTDKVITTEEADDLLDMAKKILEFGGSMGGSSKFDFHSGYLSKERYYINIFGLDEMENILTRNDFNTFTAVKEKTKCAVAKEFRIHPSAIYMTYPTFFSVLRPKDPLFIGDWPLYNENVSNHTFSYSTVIYLGDYGTDFKDGRLIFNDNIFNSTLEPKKGRVVMFTSGDENVHEIEDVTWGSRYALEISFTCDKNYAIPDPDISQYGIMN